jgi:signal transduction histidine kinase
MTDSSRVLLVAAPDFAEAAARRLRAVDDRFDVEVASSGRTALERLDGAVDCVVSGYELPDTDGVDLLETVRKDRPDLPFLLFPEAGSETIASEAIAAGVTDYVPKDGDDQYAVLADRIAAAVDADRAAERAQAHEQEAQKAKIRALHTVAARIAACDSSDAVYDAVVEAAEAILEFDIAIADAVVEDVLVPRAVSTELSADEYYDETPVDAEDNLAAEVHRTREASIIDDLRARDVVPADSKFRSALTVPIGEYGVFQTVSRERAGFDRADLELAELLASHARARLSQLEAIRERQQRTEELQRQNERLDEFARFVSHDLRNPLTVARGHLDLAAEDCDCDSGHLDHVAEAHERMDALIEDLMALAREEKTTTEYESVALGELVERCWRTVETRDATLDVDADATIRADHDRLRQLLENLLRNAVEHGSTSPPSQTREDAVEHGSTSPRSQAREDADHGDGVTITVGRLENGFYIADDGAGIPAAERERVFESGYSTNRDGTGFGLSIVRKIAEAHDWDIEVAESDAGGARFEITGVETDR